MSFVVLDTDVASVSLRGRLSPALRARLAGESLCVTFVTWGELTKWTVLRDWGPRRLADLASWRSGVVLLPFDEQVEGCACRRVDARPIGTATRSVEDTCGRAGPGGSQADDAAG